MKVKYTGTSDFQSFSKADFEKAEVDQNKLTFERGVPVEVPDEVGQALVSKEGVFGDFSFEEADDEEGEPRSSSDQEVTPDESSDAPTDTGRGTSTRGAARSRSTGGKGSSTAR